LNVDPELGSYIQVIGQYVINFFIAVTTLTIVLCCCILYMSIYYMLTKIDLH